MYGSEIRVSSIKRQIIIPAILGRVQHAETTVELRLDITNAAIGVNVIQMLKKDTWIFNYPAET